MKDIDKLLSAYNKLEQEFMKQKEELEKLKSEQQMGKIWKPIKVGDVYYYIDRYSGVGCAKIDDIHDLEIADYDIKCGNCYLTREQAEFEANREKYTRLFRQCVEQHSEPLDWKKLKQEKWYIYYDYVNDIIRFEYYETSKDLFTIYASSEKVLREAIQFIGEDNFKKYILEVEDVKD